jgi:uncharacterized membrane protein
MGWIVVKARWIWRRGVEHTLNRGSSRLDRVRVRVIVGLLGKHLLMMMLLLLLLLLLVVLVLLVRMRRMSVSMRRWLIQAMTLPLRRIGHFL